MTPLCVNKCRKNQNPPLKFTNSFSNNSSFAPLISITVKTVRVKNNIFKEKSFAYIS